MIGQTVSHYRILAPLAEGGMGAVYEAEDLYLGRRVAIKFIRDVNENEEARVRFQREARLASALHHPNIAVIYEFGLHEDRQFIAMELVKGRPLSHWLKDETLTLGQRLQVIVDVAVALDAAHRHGIVHRDIKPQNIMVNEVNDHLEVKVLDFGLAKQIAPRDEENETDLYAPTLADDPTRANLVMGTPHYMSPEQARGAQLDARSDLFSLGVVLYQALTGQLPFSGKSFAEIGGALVHVEPPPPSHHNPRLDARLDGVTMKALAKDTDERYQTAEEMLRELRAAQANPAETNPNLPPVTLAQPPGNLPTVATQVITPAQRARLRRGALLIALALLVVGVCVYAFFWRPSHKDEYQPQRPVLELYEDGLRALRAGLYLQASEHLRRAVEHDQRFVLARARLAEALMALDSFEEAKSRLLEANNLATQHALLSPRQQLYLHAITSSITGNFQQAVTYYTQLAETATAEQRASAAFDLANAWEHIGNTDKAIEWYRNAQEPAPRGAAALLRLAVQHGRRKEMATAENYFRDALARYKDAGQPEGMAEVHLQRGILLNELNWLDEAKEELEQAIAVAQILTHKQQQVRAELQLSTIASFKGDDAQARRLVEGAIELAHKEGLGKILPQAFNDLGNSYLIRSEFSAAKENFQRALSLAEQQNLGRAIARAQLSLGSLASQQNDPKTALSYGTAAKAFYERNGYRKELLQVLLLLGRANRETGKYDEAEQDFKQQLELAKAASDESQIALASGSLGTLLDYQEQYPKALSYFEQSRQINHKLQITVYEAYDLTNCGHMLWQLGRYAESRQMLNQADAIANQPGSQVRQLAAWVLLLNARLALSQAKLSEALNHSKQAVRLVAREPHSDVALSAKYTLGTITALQGEQHAGLSLCQEAWRDAIAAKNARLQANALLAVAEVLATARRPAEALSSALQACEELAQTKQGCSHWQAQLLVSRLYHHLRRSDKARQHATRANDLLQSLQQQWEANDFLSYSQRPDIAQKREQLNQLLRNLSPTNPKEE